MNTDNIKQAEVCSSAERLCYNCESLSTLNKDDVVDSWFKASSLGTSQTAVLIREQLKVSILCAGLAV